MKIKQIVSVVFACSILAFAAGCKKDKDTPAKNFVVTSFGDTAGLNTNTFTYDAAGRLTRMASSSFSYDLYYSGDKLIKRTYSSGIVVEEIDSIYYDPSNRIFKAVKYDAVTNDKEKTTVFAFNADNTINSATIDFVDPLTDDELFEFTYAGGKLAQRNKSVKQGGIYKLKYKLEYQAYDDKANPFASLYYKSLVDVIEAFLFFSAYPNNLTLGKLTEYDTTTGSVTGITPVTLTYTYNSDGLPTRMDVTQGGATGAYVMSYTEL